MEPDSGRAGMDDPQRIDAARRVLAEAPGEAIDRLTALSARLLGAAHAQVSIFTDEQVVLPPAPARRPPADTLCARTLAGGTPLALADVRDLEGIGSFLGVPIEV